MSPVVDEVIAKMTNAITIEDSAIVFIQGVPGMIAAAVQEATDLGATAEQLVPVSNLGTDLQAKSDALAAALQPPPPGPQAKQKH